MSEVKPQDLDRTDFQPSSWLADRIDSTAGTIATAYADGWKCKGFVIEARPSNQADRLRFDIDGRTKRLYRAIQSDEAEDDPPEEDGSDEEWAADDREDLLAELAGAEARIEELEAELKTEAAGADGLLVKEDGYEERIERLEAARDSAVEEIGRLQEERDEAESRAHDLEAKVDRLKADLGSSRADATVKKGARDELYEENARLREERDELRHEIEAVNNWLENHPVAKLVTESGRDAKNVGDWVGVYLDVAETEIDDLRREVAELEAELTRAQQQYHQVSADLVASASKYGAKGKIEAVLDAAWDLVSAHTATGSDRAGLVSALADALRGYYEGAA